MGLRYYITFLFVLQLDHPTVCPDLRGKSATFYRDGWDPSTPSPALSPPSLHSSISPGWPIKSAGPWRLRFSTCHPHFTGMRKTQLWKSPSVSQGTRHSQGMRSGRTSFSSETSLAASLFFRPCPQLKGLGFFALPSSPFA